MYSTIMFTLLRTIIPTPRLDKVELQKNLKSLRKATLTFLCLLLSLMSDKKVISAFKLVIVVSLVAIVRLIDDTLRELQF